MSIRNNRRLTLSLAIVSVIALTLSVVHSTQGARAVQVSEKGTLARKTLVMDFNTELRNDSTPSVQIEPNIAHTLIVQNKRLLLRFDEPLRYDSTYRIQLEKIQDTRNHYSSFETTLTTDAQKIGYLKRNPGDKDEIRTRIIGVAGSDTTRFAHERIGDFAIHDEKKMLVLTEKQTPRVETTLLFIEGDATRELTIPKGTALELETNAMAESVLIRTRDMDTLENYLFQFNWSTQTFAEITQSNGNSIHASEALFAPDGKTIIYASASDGALYMLDPLAKREPLNFGTITAFRRYLPNDAGVFFESQPGRYELVTVDGQEQLIIDDITIQEAKITSTLEPILIKSAFTLTNPSQQIMKQVGSENRTLATYSTKVESISTLDLSPNDQYISFIIHPSPTIFDGYRINPEANGSYVRIIDGAGTLIETFQGSQINWL